MAFWLNEPTRKTFHSSRRTFFMGKWGAEPLQNFVTIPNRVTAKHSSPIIGCAVKIRTSIVMNEKDELQNVYCMDVDYLLSSILKRSLAFFNSSESLSSSIRIVSTITYITFNNILKLMYDKRQGKTNRIRKLTEET